MLRSSCLMTVYLVWASESLHKQNASGWLSCDMTAPSRNLEASVKMLKGLVESEYINMTWFANSIFRVSDFQLNFAHFLLSSVSSVSTLYWRELFFCNRWSHRRCIFCFNFCKFGLFYAYLKIAIPHLVKIFLEVQHDLQRSQHPELRYR